MTILIIIVQIKANKIAKRLMKKEEVAYRKNVVRTR